MCRLKNSELRVIIISGTAPGTTEFIGYHLFFRADDDSMNMHIECPPDFKALKGTIDVAAEMSGTASISHAKFIANFVRWFTEKKEQGKSRLLAGADPDTEPSVADPPPPAATTTTVPVPADDLVHPKRARVATDDVPSNECTVCMSAPADTLVLPCGHSVVCAKCSLILARTTDSNRKHCVVCRESITHVAYPDNTLVPIGGAGTPATVIGTRYPTRSDGSK